MEFLFNDGIKKLSSHFSQGFFTSHSAFHEFPGASHQKSPDAELLLKCSILEYMKNVGYESYKCGHFTKKHSCVTQDLKLRCIQCTVILVHSRRVDSYICPSAAAQNYRSLVSCDCLEYFMAQSFNEG